MGADLGRTDAMLWQAMQRGGMASLGALFDRHADRVHRYCTRAAASVEDAEDALSETFLEAWRSAGSFTVRGDSALPILLAIARRALQKQHRSSVRRLVREHSGALDPHTEDVAETIAGADELAGRKAWLRRTVAELPAPYRNVYELCLYAELSQKDVATTLGIPPGTVKSRLSRARSIIAEEARKSFGATAGIGEL